MLSDGLPAGYHAGAAISGTRVVWHRAYSDPDMGPRQQGDLWLADLAGGAPRLLRSGEFFNPRIAGDRVCFDARGPYGVALHHLDLSSGRSGIVAPGGERCDLSGRRVVWLSYRGGFWSAYTDELP